MDLGRDFGWNNGVYKYIVLFYSYILGLFEFEGIVEMM